MKARQLVRALVALFLVVSAARLGAVQSKNSLNLANPVSDTTDALALSYSPNGMITARGTVTVGNGTQNADNRAFCVVFKLTNPGLQGGLGFNLVNVANGNVLSLSGAPTSSTQAISGSFASGTPAGSRQVFTIEFQANALPIPPPGTYTATITESLYGGSTMPSGSVLDTNTLTVTITVGAFYDLSVVASGSGFSVTATSQSLDFGVLSAGKTLGADILVRSNVAYSLSISSANRGSFANPNDATSAVGYSLSSNGIAVPLNPGPGHVASGAPATYGNPARYAISVAILPILNFPSAGSYADTVTVTLTSP